MGFLVQYEIFSWSSLGVKKSTTTNPFFLIAYPLYSHSVSAYPHQELITSMVASADTDCMLLPHTIPLSPFSFSSVSGCDWSGTNSKGVLYPSERDPELTRSVWEILLGLRRRQIYFN